MSPHIWMSPGVSENEPEELFIEIVFLEYEGWSTFF